MEASVRFLYLYCNDLAPMRRFYSDLLKLDEIYFDAGNAVAYKCDMLQFSITQVDQELPVIDGWAIQPGWSGGTQPIISWSIECDEDAFRSIVVRLKDEGVPSFYLRPQWAGYWSYPVRDPMGNTVELTYPHGDPDWWP